MSRGQHAADDGSFGKSASGAMARGLALIVVAVVVGVLLLKNTDASPRPAVVLGEGDTTETTAVVDNGSTTVTQPTVPIAHDPATVRVLVANGSGVKGAASRVAEVLHAANFLTATPVNTKSPVTASAVYFGAGYEADARAVAALLKPGLKVSPMPATLPVASLDNAQVLVIVGADLAAPSNAPGSTTTAKPRAATTTTGPPTSG